MDEDKERSISAMVNANTTMIREVIRHLVEEGMMDGAKASKMVIDAADSHFPQDDSSGRLYDLGRSYLVKLAQAFSSFPGVPGNDHAKGPPQKDIR